MTQAKNKELQLLIQKIQEFPPNSREGRKLMTKLMKSIGGYIFYDRKTGKETQVSGILLSLESLVNMDLQSLAGKTKKSGKASTRFKSLIPQKHLQEELYAEAKVNTFCYIHDNINEYDPEKGTVRSWVNRTLCLKFLDAFNNEYRGTKLQKAKAESLDAPIKLGSTTTWHDCLPARPPSKKHEIHRLFRELIQNDPEDFLKNEMIRSRKTGNQISLQKVLLMRLEDRTLEAIDMETGVSFRSISSCINRKKAELRAYITKHTGITADDL